MLSLIEHASIVQEFLCVTFSQIIEQKGYFHRLTLYKMLGKVLCQGLSSFPGYVLASLAHSYHFMEKI